MSKLLSRFFVACVVIAAFSPGAMSDSMSNKPGGGGSGPTTNPVSLAQGGTGTAAGSAAAARTGLGAAASGVNADITSTTAMTAVTGLAQLGLNAVDVNPATISKAVSLIGATANLPLHDQVNGNVHILFGNNGGNHTVQIQAGDALYLDGSNFPVSGSYSLAPGDCMIITSEPQGVNTTWYQGVVLSARSYPIANQVITAAGTLTLAHNLGRVPYGVQASLVCTAGELGYSIGDTVFVSGSPGAANTGVSLTVDATNVVVRYGSAASTFSIPHKTTGVNTGITNGSWTLRLFPQ